jgi:uncharacterized protein YbcV (DUF1398 family)
VVKGMGPEIYNVLTYPNPVSTTGILNIHVINNQPDETISTLINLYNVNGQLVYQYQQPNADPIQWNISELNLSAGIYIYQVNIKNPTSSYTSKTGKIIVNQ